MPQFRYTALSRSGARVNGVVEGFNELDAASRIKETCDVILKLAEVRENRFLSLLSFDIGSRRLDRKAFGIMCSQFAIILEAGIPIARAVRLVGEKTADKTIRRLLDETAADVESGRSLSAAFEDHGAKLLPITFIETLRAGEATGNLARSFRMMQEHYDKENKMRAKIKSAMAYPTFVLTVSVIVVIVLMAKVVPTFTSMFTEMNIELPLMTRMLIAVSEFFRKSFLLLLILIGGGILGLKVYGSSERGRINLARLKLKLPILGNIEELGAASQFANTMTAMLGAGLPMTRAVSITSKVISNYYLGTQTGKLCEKLETGHALGAAMREETSFPDILVDMTAVGESSGEPERTLATVAAYYDEELDEATKSALAKIEPALLIGIAGIAGFIVLAVFLAMFSMYGGMNSV